MNKLRTSAEERRPCLEFMQQEPECELLECRLAADLEDALGLLCRFAKFWDRDCRFDHEGVCQEHLLERDCSVRSTRALLGEQYKAGRG